MSKGRILQQLLIGQCFVIACPFALVAPTMVSTRRMAAKASRLAKASSTAKPKTGRHTKKSPLLAAAPPNAVKTTQSDEKPRMLFSLAENDELVTAKLVCRPSKRNRSPYVADVHLLDEDREAIAHVPNLDMGGKCVPGAMLLLRPARDRKGVKVPSTAVNPKYGTPKCEFIAQLLHVDESSLSSTLYPPTWVGAHPSLGERIAESWLRNNLVEGIPPIVEMQTQVQNPCGADMRSDFLLHHADGTKRLVEVKTVVDTDYSSTAPPEHMKCRFLTDNVPYTRTAIFPWGNSNQKGPDGEKVVSARAIKHVHELTQIAVGKLKDGNERYQTTVLFVVIRGDAQGFRPNYEACPSFLKYLKIAKDAGVQVLAKRVKWGTDQAEGKCFDDIMLPIDWPAS